MFDSLYAYLDFRFYKFMLFFKILVFTSINLLYKYKLMRIINKKIKILKELKY